MLYLCLMRQPENTLYQGIEGLVLTIVKYI